MPGAELWVVGNPRMPLRACRELAATSTRRSASSRFVDEAEIPAIFRRADVIALPYWTGHSGVLYTALAFGSAISSSAWSAASKAGRPHRRPPDRSPGEAPALAAALRELIADADSRAEMEAAARRAAAGEYSCRTRHWRPRPSSSTTPSRLPLRR